MSGLDGRVDSLPHQSEAFLPLLPAVQLRIHGKPDQIAAPVLRDLPEQGRIDVLREPGQPVGAHAPELNGVSGSVRERNALHVKRAVYGWADRFGGGIRGRHRHGAG